MNDDDKKILIEYFVGGKRFVELNNYIFDKLIFGVYILVLLLLFVVVFFSYGSDKSDHLFYVCNAKSIGLLYCEQPFYQNYPLCEKAWFGACDQKLVPDGFSFGSPAPLIFKFWGLIISVLLAGAFVINHLIHNKNFRKNIEVKS